MLFCRFYGKPRRQCLWNCFLSPVLPAELLSTAFQLFLCFPECICIDNGRIEIITEVMPVSQDAFCRAVVHFDTGFFSGFGKGKSGKIVSVEFSYFPGILFVNDGNSVFNPVSEWCMSHGLKSFLSASDRISSQSRVHFWILQECG